ncbi:hypothetical protein ACGFR8_13565 [Streptomyces brevispora]
MRLRRGDGTGTNDDDVLVNSYCLPRNGHGEYTIGAEGSSVTVAVYRFG